MAARPGPTELELAIERDLRTGICFSKENGMLMLDEKVQEREREEGCDGPK